MKDAKQAAVEIRKILKTTYPGTKFSVRTKCYSGGSSVDVSWTDGPTEHEVQDLTARFRGHANGYYNEYGGTGRRTSREAMEAAAKAAGEYYGMDAPAVAGGDYPYIESYETVPGCTDAICDLVHRAVWKTSLVGVTDLDAAFAEAYPI